MFNNINVILEPGCISLRQPPNGGVQFILDGAVVSFYCNWNYELVGNPVLYCDGIRWNGTQPVCQSGKSQSGWAWEAWRKH
jgi:hypothetical protein